MVQRITEQVASNSLQYKISNVNKIIKGHANNKLYILQNNDPKNEFSDIPSDDSDVVTNTSCIFVQALHLHHNTHLV